MQTLEDEGAPAHGMVNIKQVGVVAFSAGDPRKGLCLFTPPPQPLELLLSSRSGISHFKSRCPGPAGKWSEDGGGGTGRGGAAPARGTDRPPAPGPEVLTPSLVEEGVDVL